MASISDDFNRADSTDLGAGWVEVSGDWSIISNRLSPGAAGGTIILRAAGAMASSDHYAQVTIAATTAASHGVWCRGNSNISQGYLWRNDGSNWTLFSVVGGSFSSIGTYAAAAAPGDVAKIQAVGSTITAYVNGVQRVSVTDTNVTTGTSVGLRSESTSAIRFDDFAAADVVAGSTISIAGSSETAQPLTGTKASTLATAAETDTAQPLTGAKTTGLTPAAAQEAAQPLSGAKAAGLAPAGEGETGQSLAGSKTALLGTAAEADTSQAVAGAKTTTVGIAGSTEAAQVLTGGTPAVLGVTGEVESALPLAGTKRAVLGVAVEGDAARVLTVPSIVVPSPERTFRIPAEGRRFVVAAEGRRLVVVAEDRTLTIRR